jgi:putative phosphotransacetylase
MNMRVDSPCPSTLEGLLVRVHPDWKLEVHIDTDEANCCDLPHASRVMLTRA